jgi:hypothetical protein
MKQPWWALLVVAVLGVGAGVGVATAIGDDTSADSSIIIGPGSAPPDDGALDSSVTTTAVAPTDTSDTNTAATTTTVPSITSTTAAVTATTEPEPVEPALTEITIVIANGADDPRQANGLANALRFIGYPNVTNVDGAEVFGATVLYVREGFEATGDRVITDLQTIDADFVSPLFVVAIDGSPELVPEVPEADIIVYIGTNDS